MSSFLVMECKGKAPIGRVDVVTDIEDAPWQTGALVKNPSDVIVYKTHSTRRGNLKAMYGLSVPIIRQDLLQALLDAGVDNLQLFDAVVRDPVTGAEHTNYRAFNVVGVVMAADMGKSELMHEDTLTGVDRDFAHLVLDEGRIRSGLLLFRLAEATNAIVVHEKIKDMIEARNIEGMVFYEPGEWSG